MWKKLLWLLLPLFAGLLWAEYTWQQSIQSGPFLHIRSNHSEIINQMGMRQADADLVAQIEKLGKHETIQPYLESIGFTCKSYFGGTPPTQAMLEDAVLQPYCFFQYGMFGRSHQWRVGYNVLTSGKVQHARSFQFCRICP